jgi:hypothetical protein
MEGAVLSGKLAAEVICDKAAPGTATAMSGVRKVPDCIVRQATLLTERAPVGVRGEYPIAFGGGQQGAGGKIGHP